jgi:hypothetical protein
MSVPYHTITLRHDPDNPAAVALVDRIYAMIMPECVGISTTWEGSLEEHRFHIAG